MSICLYMCHRWAYMVTYLKLSIMAQFTLFEMVSSKVILIIHAGIG